MKVAVIGGGTAGYMAAAHLTKHLPTLKLFHIYDPRLPAIGVGEGTVPAFLTWLHEITGLTFPELQEKSYVTPKVGIEFENWGKKHRRYTHYFSRREGPAYHISADKLVPLLQDYVSATYLEQRVIDVVSTGQKVTIVLENNNQLEVDFAFDARGFPKTLDHRHLELSCIPTNVALLQRGAAVEFQEASRSVARPHGWILVIPLRTYTSYGYIYNSRLSSSPDVKADFDQFLKEEQVSIWGPPRTLPFPNFLRRTFFDGALFRIGNSGSFLEPLEATAIAIILIQLRLASYWLLDNLLGLSQPESSDQALKTMNQYLFDFIQKTALFIGWHYAAGSYFDTPFWQFAVSNFERTLEELAKENIGQEFDRYLQSGVKFPEALAFATSPQELDNIVLPHPSQSTTFGGFLDVSFAKVGHGIDYFSRRSL